MSNILNFVGKLSSHPEDFFTPSTELSQQVKHNLKSVFDYAATTAIKPRNNTKTKLNKKHSLPQNSSISLSSTSLLSSNNLPFQELYVDGFDTEQIWGMLQMQHTPILSALEAQLLSMENDKHNMNDQQDIEDIEIDTKYTNEKDSRKHKADNNNKTNTSLTTDTKGKNKRKSSNLDMDNENDSIDENDTKKSKIKTKTKANSNNTKNSKTYLENDEDDLEAFLDEGDRAMERILAIKRGEHVSDDDNTDDENDDFLDFDINAPLPELDDEEEDNYLLYNDKKLTAIKSNSKDKSAKLAEIISSGPRFEDFYGSKEDYAKQKEESKSKKKISSRTMDYDDDEIYNDNDENDTSNDDEEELEYDENDYPNNKDDIDISTDDDEFIDQLGYNNKNKKRNTYDEDDEEDEEEGGFNEDDDEDGLEEDGFNDDENDQDDDDDDPDARAKRRRHLLDMDEPEDDDDDDNMDDEETTKPLSRHEREKLKLAAQIRELEAEAIADKTWELRGEIGSTKRPENSLLSAELDYQQAVKSAPVVTVETTTALEDVIKQRIRDNTYDDPVRKDAPLPDPAKNPTEELSAEKSKEGLGDVYAAEYASKALGINANDEKIKHMENDIINLWTKISGKLDALSNFHFTPKAPTIPDMSVTPSVPAIAMEEAIPLAVSNAQAQAPEEVYDRKTGRQGILKSKGEKDAQEREADRRAKKRVKRKEKAMKEREERMLQRSNPGLGNPYSRKEALAQIEASGNKKNGVVIKTGEGVQKGKNNNNTTTMMSGVAGTLGQDNNARLSNSTALFTKLQEEATSIRQQLSSSTNKGNNSKQPKSGSKIAALKL